MRADGPSPPSIRSGALLAATNAAKRGRTSCGVWVQFRRLAAWRPTRLVGSGASRLGWACSDLAPAIPIGRDPPQFAGEPDDFSAKLLTSILP
jgi:hypothetical protein